MRAAPRQKLENHTLTGSSWSLVAAIALALGLMATTGHASPDSSIEFSEGFMIGGGAIDMSRYANGNPLTPGEYSVDIHVNGVFHQSSDITFVPSGDSDIASPCLSSALIGGLPLKPALLRALEEQGTACVDLPSLIEGATVGFDSGTLQLSLGIPQAALAGITRGHVPPEQREDGITAGFMDYSFNHHRGRGS